MVNEWTYCPRLAYLEWVEGEWSHSADTAQGKRAHALVDKGGGKLPAPDQLDEDRAKARSVMMSSDRLGVIAKMDVVEASDGMAVPVDFKKGKRPHVAAGAYDPERVQICVQGMILEDNGYRVEEGALWYVGSRERVRIELDDEAAAHDAGRDRGASAGRVGSPASPAPGEQPEVSAVLAGGDMPAGRDQHVPQGIPPAPAEPGGRPGPSPARAGAGVQGSQARGLVAGGDGGRRA